MLDVFESNILWEIISSYSNDPSCQINLNVLRSYFLDSKSSDHIDQESLYMYLRKLESAELQTNVPGYLHIYWKKSHKISVWYTLAYVALSPQCWLCA